MICIAFHRENLTPEALRYGSRSFTLQIHHTCLYLVSIHQTAPPLASNDNHLIAAYCTFIDPRESSPVRDRRSTTELHR